MEGDATGQPASWNTLTSYLANITDGSKNTFYYFLMKRFALMFCFLIKRVDIFLQSRLLIWRLDSHWIISWMEWIAPNIFATMVPWPPPHAMRLWFGPCLRSRSKSAKIWWVLFSEWPGQCAWMFPAVLHTANPAPYLVSRLTVSAQQFTSSTAQHHLSWPGSSGTSSQPYQCPRRPVAAKLSPTLWGSWPWASFWGRVRAENKLRLEWCLSCWRCR